MLTLMFGASFISSCRRHISTSNRGDVRIFYFTPPPTKNGQEEVLPGKKNAREKEIFPVGVKLPE